MSPAAIPPHTSANSAAIWNTIGSDQHFGVPRGLFEDLLDPRHLPQGVPVDPDGHRVVVQRGTRLHLEVLDPAQPHAAADLGVLPEEAHVLERPGLDTVRDGGPARFVKAALGNPAPDLAVV